MNMKKMIPGIIAAFILITASTANAGGANWSFSINLNNGHPSYGVHVGHNRHKVRHQHKRWHKQSHKRRNHNKRRYGHHHRRPVVRHHNYGHHHGHRYHSHRGHHGHRH